MAERETRAWCKHLRRHLRRCRHSEVPQNTPSTVGVCPAHRESNSFRHPPNLPLRGTAQHTPQLLETRKLIVLPFGIHHGLDTRSCPLPPIVNHLPGLPLRSPGLRPLWVRSRHIFMSSQRSHSNRSGNRVVGIQAARFPIQRPAAERGAYAGIAGPRKKCRVMLRGLGLPECVSLSSLTAPG